MCVCVRERERENEATIFVTPPNPNEPLFQVIQSRDKAAAAKPFVLAPTTNDQARHVNGGRKLGLQMVLFKSENPFRTLPYFHSKQFKN